MTTQVTVEDLLKDAIGTDSTEGIFPVSTSAGFKSGCQWFEAVKAFALNSKETDLPNKMAIVRDCTEIMSHTTIVPAPTNYSEINNDGEKIIAALTAITYLAGD